MSLKARLVALIAQEGPLSVAQYMAACLYDPRDGYYATRPALGRDFTTAPEISQMFGELIGLWCVQSWFDLGRPAPFQLVELGPGRGTLMADAARAARIAPEFREAAQLTFVEVSSPLRRAQADALRRVGAAPNWVDRLDQVSDGPALILGNEFLDCLPIRQFLRVGHGWIERVIGRDAHDALTFGIGGALPESAVFTTIPAPLQNAPEGALVEVRTGLPALVDDVARRLKAYPCRALFIDYGPERSMAADTLQAIRGGEKVDPLAYPGESDLTAHVDFGELRRLSRASGLDVAGPAPQGLWLDALGLGLRAQALAQQARVQARPDQAEAIGVAYDRLTSPTQMGTLFQAICLSTPGLPAPAGFPP